MKKPLIIAGSSFAILLFLFFIADPAKVPAVILILPFLLLFMGLFSMALYIFGTRKRIEDRRQIKLAALCASLPILLLVLQSIGQLTLRDVITVGILFVLSYFYILRSAVSS
jgi:hypothetical protein